MGCGGCRGGASAAYDPNFIGGPVVLPDESIKYPDGAEPDSVDGYTQHPSDPTILIPDSAVPCSEKIVGIILQQSGTYRPFKMCNHQGCPQVGREVSSETCAACPFRK